MRIGLFLLCLFVCFSCKKKTDNKALGHSDKVIYISQDSLAEGTLGLVDSVKYIKLETKDNCLLGEIKKLEIYDEKIFIQDVNQNLYVFAGTGQFVTKIGQRGRGAEEYVVMSGFCLDKENDLVGIIDVIGGKITYYNFEGTYIKDVRSNSSNFNYLLSSVQYKNVLLNFYTCFFQVIYSVQVYDIENMELKQSLNPYPMNRMANSIWTRRPYAETSEGISFIKPHSDTIFLYDGTTVRPHVILEHDLPLVTQHACDAFNREISNDETFYSFLDYLSTNGFFQGILKIYETKDYLLISVRAEKGTTSHIVWNKKQKKGRYEEMFVRYDKEYIYRPFIQSMISSTDDYFIGVYYDYNINSFANISPIDPEMQEIVRNWNEEDNPVVALFYMKREI